MSVSASGASITNINTLTTTGNMSHGGLTFTGGVDIDQRRSIAIITSVTAGSYVTLTTGGTHLTTGTYCVQVYVHTGPTGGAIWDETFSGIMSWYSGGTNDTDETSNVTIHNMGHAINGRTLTLRTRRPSSGTSIMEFTFSHNQPTFNYTWYFRRIM